MTTPPVGLSAIRSPGLLRVGLATFQPAAGVPALLASTAAVEYGASGTAETAPWWPYLVAVVIGALAITAWGLARKRPNRLIALAALVAALAVAMILFEAFVIRPVRSDPHLGYWDSSWYGAAAALLWILILLAALGEWRLARRHPDSQTDPSPPTWTKAVAVVAALAVVAAFVGLINQIPGWELRVNSLTSGHGTAVRTDPSRLSGATRWQFDALGGDPASLVTAAGLAVPVAADDDHSAGVIMIDPATGTVRWRYQLRGAETLPDLSSTDGGRAIVINFDEAETEQEQIPHRVFTLDAQTGRFKAFWPDDVTETDPPVRFHQVARGTNSVSGMSVDGRRLWTFKPAECADPRGAVSTPDVIVVTTRKCDNSVPRVVDELRGFDARTGDQLWIRPWDSDSAPDQLLASKDFQVELTDAGTLQRRDLHSGKINWTAHLACPEPSLTSASEKTIFIHSCSADGSHPDVLQAYDLSSGKLRWQRRAQHQRITALAAIDDQRVIALAVDTSGKNRSCAATLIGPAGSVRTLRSFPEDTRADDPYATYRPGLVQCQDSSIHQLGGSVVLQLHLSSPPGASIVRTRYRFFGLS